MSTKETVAEAIRCAREALGLTQQQVAERAGFANLQTVSAIELAQREVRSWELVKLATALRTTVAALLVGGDMHVPARVFWRRGGLSECHADLEAQFRERVRRFGELEAMCGMSPAVLLPQFPLDPIRASYRDADRLAGEVSRTLDLGSRPAASLLPVLESRFRVRIFYEEMDDGQSAACVLDAGGTAILLNRREAPWRRNYNVAHELFHLVTWRAVADAWPAAGEPSWYSKLEKLAQSFAASLLIPADEVRTEIDRRLDAGPLRYADLIEVARDFSVSADALVWRLVNLRYLEETEAKERLTDPEFQRLNRFSTAGLWTDPPIGLPERYQMMVRMAFEDGMLSRVRAAAFLEVSASDLHDFEWSTVDGASKAIAS